MEYHIVTNETDNHNNPIWFICKTKSDLKDYVKNFGISEIKNVYKMTNKNQTEKDITALIIADYLLERC